MTQSASKIEYRETDRYVSEPELRTYLGYSASTIRRLRKKGLPCVGTDRLRRYHLASVLQWLAEQTLMKSEHVQGSLGASSRDLQDRDGYPLPLGKVQKEKNGELEECDGSCKYEATRI